MTDKKVEYVGGYAAIVNDEEQETQVSCPYCGIEGIKITYGDFHFVCPSCNQTTAVFRSEVYLKKYQEMYAKEE